MKNDTDSRTKEELLEENRKLRERIARFEKTDITFRPEVKVEADDNFFINEQGFAKTVLTRIEDFVYYVENNRDGTKTIRYVGPQLEKILGITRGQYINDATVIIDHCHPDDLPGVYEKARRLRVERKPQSFIYRFLHDEKKTYIWLEETVYPQFDETGYFYANLGIIRNVTERVRAEEELRESRHALERVLNTIDQVVYHIDSSKPKGERIKFVSDNLEKIFGVSREEFISGNSAFVSDCHPDDIETIRKTTEVLHREKKAQTYFYRFRHRKTGEYIWIEEHVIPGYDNEGNQVEIFGVARDVTARLVSEEKLRESEERFRMLAQNASDMVYRYRIFPKPGYEYMSPSSTTITGYTPEEFYADPELGIKITAPEDRGLMEVFTKKISALKPGETSTKIQPVVFRSTHKNGNVVWTETTSQPVFDANGKLVALDGISRDITSRKQFEEELIESRGSYKTLVEEIADGIVIAGFDQKILFANKAVLEISGIAKIDDLIGHSLLEFLSPAQQKRSAERIRDVIEGKPVLFELIEIQHSDGRIVECESRPSLYTYMGKQTILVFLRNTTAERQLQKEQLRAQVAEENNRQLQEEILERARAERELSNTQTNLRLLIDSSIDMICASDNNGYITEFNKAAQKTFGYTSEEVIGKHVSFLYERPQERIDVMNELVERTGFFTGEVNNKKKNGEIFTALLSASILKDEHGNVIGSMGVSRDITASKRAEKELRLSEEKYRAIYNQAYIGIALVDTESDGYIDVNQRLSDMLGYSPEDLRTKTIHDLRLPGDLSRLPTGKDFIKRGFERIIDEHRYRHKNGNEVIVNVTISLVRGEDQRPLYFVYVYEDLTPKRRAEEQIRLQAAKLNSIFESSSHMIWTVDTNHRMTSFNGNQADWLRRSYGINAYIGMSMITGRMVSSEEYNRYWMQKIEQTLAGSAQHFETSFTHPGGETTWREIYLNPIFDENENVVEISAIAHDITDKKQSEETLRLSLKEKEVLLKEVHHRVKNNLQVISSILNLQSSYVRDKRILEILLESQNRIKSMAFVHESLYQTKDFSNISFQEYVGNISRNLVHSYASVENPPELKLDLDPVQLHLDTAIPCGLIINELVSNALKYAFRDTPKGKIGISVKQKEKKITISISDNGVGLPPDLDFRNTESLGLQLVVSLVEQINGKIKADTKKGTKFTIEFAATNVNA